MNAKDLTLNIAVNLGRIGRWACEGKRKRLDQFLEETDIYIKQLEKQPKSLRFQKTFDKFVVVFNNLRSDMSLDLLWIESMFTWANILTHRAKLAGPAK